MRLVKYNEWELVGFNEAGFVFKSTQYAGELMVLRQAKYILSRDVVLFMNLDDKPIVTPSRSTRPSSVTSVRQSFQNVIDTANKRYCLA